MIKSQVAAVLTKALDHAFPQEVIHTLLETPKHQHLGDVASMVPSLNTCSKNSGHIVVT
ncbi:hypothetical protein ACI2JA_06350 [Alkalihalobacillus sp. NPDC078783]